MSTCHVICTRMGDKKEASERRAQKEALNVVCLVPQRKEIDKCMCVC